MAAFDYGGEYCDWLRKNIKVEEVLDGWVEIATPFLDSINDGLVVYAKKSGNRIVLSDDGYVLNNLNNDRPGAFAGAEGYKSFLRIVQSLEVDLSGGALVKTTTVKNFASSLNLFIRALIVISHLPYVVTEEG